MGWMLIGLITSGCGRAPFAAQSNLRLTPEEERAKAVLTADDQRIVVSALKGSDDGRAASERSRAAEHGVRWADVEAAVLDACSDVEMAVVETIREDEGSRLRFRLKTIEEWPGELVVRRVEPPTVYEATATVSDHPDWPQRRERADALLIALEQRMTAYGRKRSYKPIELRASGG